MRTVDLPPNAPTLMESTRAIGYSLEAAIADIVDNSISAVSTNIDIDFFPYEDAFISILDDGVGMDASALICAMQYGSQNPNIQREENDLGRYGLGLKTATLSQCRQLTVVSKQQNEIHGCRWDLDHVIETGSWSLLLLETTDIDELPQIDKLRNYINGTLIIWKKLDKLSIGEIDFSDALGKQMDNVRSHLSLVFHRYLDGERGIKKISIKMNNRPLKSRDPFLLKKSTQIFDDEIILVRNSRILIKPYILPHFSKMTRDDIEQIGGEDGFRRQQGFYIYRNKRLIIWGTWFRMMRQSDLSKLARVLVDIPNSLDDLWTLDIKKSTAIPPEEVKKNLSLLLRKIYEGSKQTWTVRHKKEITDTIHHVWDRKKNSTGEIIYTINREHPLINEVVRNNPDTKRALERLLDQVEKNIPLNSLYIDLTNDEKISNENEQQADYVIHLMKDLLKGAPTTELQTYIDKLKCTEPFCRYVAEIDRAIAKGDMP